MARRLSVPYYPQSEPGNCLAACAQMVLAFQGIFRPQDKLSRQLGIKPSLGAPARNIRKIASDEVVVTFEEGSLDRLQRWLDSSIPLIAFVQGEELPYWEGEYFQHAVVIVEIEESTVWLLDPDTDANPIAVPVDDFQLAWLGMDYLYAAVMKVVS
jgi:ABC-type bacteriocin/lantibiotic exporter with double-glycine peptidase domain